MADNRMVHIRTNEEIALMQESCRIVGATLNMLRGEIRPGVSTRHLNQLAEEFIREQGGTPAFKGYRDYPASICTSINEEVVHGIPSGRILVEGEILSVDVGVAKNGYLGDGACTFAVGAIDADKHKLMQVTEEALYEGIAQARPGNHLSDIGHAIQRHVEQYGYGVVRTLVGHGIGRDLHEPPEVPNYGDPGRGPLLKAGMCLAIEPMVNAGTYQVQLQDDGWTVITADRLPSAHFEHTIAIRTTGPEILTQIA